MADQSPHPSAAAKALDEAGLDEDQVAALRRHVDAFNRAPAAVLRRRVISGLFGLGGFCAVAFVLFGAWGPALTTVCIGLLAACLVFLLRGVAGSSRLFDAVRRFLSAGHPVDWLVAAAAAVVVVLALGIFGLIGFAVWTLLVAAALALGLHLWLDRQVQRQRRGPIRLVQEILATLHRANVSEVEQRRTLLRYGGVASQELYEVLFGPQGRNAGDVEGGQAGTALAVRRPVDWRQHAVTWLEQRTEARRARDRVPRTARPQRTARTPIAATDNAAPPSMERPSAETPEHREPARVPETAPAPAGPIRVVEADAALRRAVQRSLSEPARGGAVSVLLGPHIRFIVGALLVAGCLVWLKQNDMVPDAEIGDVSRRLADEQRIDRIDDVGEKIVQRLDPSDRRTQPLSLPPLPEAFTGWIDGYSAALAGLMLIFTSLLRGARISCFAYPAAAVVIFADDWGVGSVLMVPESYVGAVAGLVVLAIGVCFHMVGGAVAAIGPLGKVNERRVSLRNARGETLHEAPGRSGRGQGGAQGALRTILVTALRARASDVHLDPDADGGSARMRVDGVMVDLTPVAREMFSRLINLVKVLCDLDIAKHRVAQEGHFSATIAERSVDYRVSYAPSVHGQKLVIRVLDAASVPHHSSDLDLPDGMLRRISTMTGQSSGMLLVCGPTGSGKTTTLYAVLRDVDLKHRNVITIEDPVEYQVDGVTQMQVREDSGSSFAGLLRSSLRQDPDVILVGEIRDADTARTAMQAAMTGHLVLSSVHAQETVSALLRLLDLGVEPNLLASSLNLVLVQRLVRRLCPHCKKAYRPDPEQRRMMGAAGSTVTRIYQPGGCGRCLNAGYLGRRALFELLTVDDAIKRVILESPTVTGLRAALESTSFTTLSQMGWQAVAEGVTSIDEVRRIAAVD